MIPCRFLNGCPLAKMFGVDPFGVYNYKLLCKRYSGLRKARQCEKYIKAEEEDDEEEVVAKEVVEEVEEEEEEDLGDAALDFEVYKATPVEEEEEEDYVVEGIGPRTPSRS